MLITSSVKKYNSYKDSGIEWVGKIPSNWLIHRIDWITNIVRGNTGFKKDELLNAGEYVALQYGKTYKVEVVDNSFNFFVNSEFFNENQITTKGDTILISTSETIEDLGHTCFYNNQNIGLLGGEQILLKPNREFLHEKYLYFYSRQFGSELKKYAKGLKVFRFSTNDLKQLFVAIPSIEEQKQIANYLDIKTTQIDHLIAKKEELIRLLEEERTAVINEMVTGKKVWNGDAWTEPAEIKDSGIEWLGEIPVHWDRARIKTLVSIKVCDGPHETPEWKEVGIPFISAEAIKGNQIDLNFKRGYISKELHLEYCKKSKVLKGDILFCKSGSTTGKSAMVEIDDDFGIWSPLAIIRVNQNKISNRFMFQSIQSSYFRNQVETSWTFGTQPNIGMGAIENLWIAIPPLQEQELIDLHLKNEILRFDLVITKTQQEIELLKEYKTALISEVVTGKVDVREL